MSPHRGFFTKKNHFIYKFIKQIFTSTLLQHCLTRKHGGYVIMRHNSIRDLYIFTELLSEIWI